MIKGAEQVVEVRRTVENVFTGTLNITWYERMGKTIITTKIGDTAYIMT